MTIEAVLLSLRNTMQTPNNRRLPQPPEGEYTHPLVPSDTYPNKPSIYTIKHTNFHTRMYSNDRSKIPIVSGRVCQSVCRAEE